MPHKNADELVRDTHNTSRFFVEHRPIAWAALFAVIAWGIYGYISMPQKKDPDIPVREAVATCTWPGATAQQVEQLVTRPIEQAIAQNKTVHPPALDNFGIRSISLAGASFVYVELSEDTNDTREQFSDINLRLQALNGHLPQGATPIQFQSDFGDTAALMLTVASPTETSLEIEARARSVESAIRQARSQAGTSSKPRVSIVYLFPLAVSQAGVADVTEQLRRSAEAAGLAEHSQVISGPGFSGVDADSSADDAQLLSFIQQYSSEQLHESEFNPDLRGPVAIRDPNETASKVGSVAGAKYSYAQLDNYTDILSTNPFERSRSLANRPGWCSTAGDIPELLTGAACFLRPATDGS